MKSQERHRLETNWMAQQLEVWIEQFRPYATTIVGVALFVMIAMLAWSYMSGSSAAWRSQAWDEYNQAIREPLPNLPLLRQSAQEHPGTKMQQMADVTWADGQVWMASRDYLFNRGGAKEAMNQAAAVYQSILQSTSDERLLNRARLGLARIYEMQDQIDKAREQYGTVTGAYQELAKARADALDKDKAKEVINWLATAEVPRPVSPRGPGTPGKSPAFNPGDMPLPGGAAPSGAASGGVGESASLDALLQGLNLDEDLPGTDQRYQTPTTTEVPAAADVPAESAPAPVDAPAESAPPPADATSPSADESKE